MKLLYCCHADNYHIEKWIPALEKVGIEIHILTLRPSKNLRNKQTVIDPIFDRITWFDFLSLAPQIRTTFKEIKADALVCSFASTYGLSGYLSGIKPFFVQTWSRDIGAAHSVSFREKLMSKFLSRYVLNQSNGITTDGPHFKRHLLNKWTEINPKKVLSTWWGIDISSWNCSSEELIQFKLSHQIPLNKPILISPRGVFWYYRPEQVLQALKHVANRLPEVQLVIPTLNHTKSKQVEGLLNELRTYTQVTILDTFIPAHEFKKWIQISDFLLSAPLFDGISEVIQEGMYCGSIPLLNAIEANIELFNAGGKGFLSASKHPNSEELFALIQQAIQTPKDELNQLKISNKLFIEQNCDVHSTANQLKSFIENQTSYF